MPVEFSLNFLSKSFALLGSADDSSWLSGFGLCSLEGVDKFCNGVSIDNESVESKGFEAFGIDCSVVFVHGHSRLSNGVDVDENGEVVQLVVGGEGSCLPDAALHHLAVPTYAVNAVVNLVEEFAGVGHPCCH